MNNEQKADKKYTLKNDVIFKTFFSRKGNEQYLIDFLNGLLNIEIKEIEIREEVNLEKLIQDEKGGSLDLQAKLDIGTIVNIEMQIRNKHNIANRTTMYGAKVLSREVKRGTDYRDIKQIIMINILDYNMLEYKEYISKTVTVLEKHREYEIIDGIKYYFIELPKYRKQKPDMNEKINQWLAFIDGEDRGRIKMAQEKNETIKKAGIEIKELTGDEEVRRIAELREKWEMDRISEINYAKEEGEKIGLKKGREKGKKEGKEEIAKNMLEKGMREELIQEITGLSKEDIEKIK